MKPIIVSNWTNPDLRATRSYVTSYTLRQGNRDLFTIDLHKQLGFYQLSEFAPSSPDSHDSFIIEQTNRVGTLKISVFEKESANMLGVLKGFTVQNDSEENLFQLIPVPQKDEVVSEEIHPGQREIKGVTRDDRAVVKFSRITASTNQKGNMLRKLASWSSHLSNAPKDIMKIEILDDELCDMRLHCAVGIILLSLKTAH